MPELHETDPGFNPDAFSAPAYATDSASQETTRETQEDIGYGVPDGVYADAVRHYVGVDYIDPDHLEDVTEEDEARLGLARGAKPADAARAALAQAVANPSDKEPKIQRPIGKANQERGKKHMREIRKKFPKTEDPSDN